MAEARAFISRVRDKGGHHAQLNNINASFVVDLNLVVTTTMLPN